MNTASAKKVLVPLAVLLAAGSLAVGSGATFTSASSNTISSVTSGTLQQTNSKADAAIFDLTNMKPGDTLNGALTITNTGSLPAAFSLTETTSTNGFDAGYLKLVVKNTTTGAQVYSGDFGGLQDGTKNDLGTVAPGAANAYTFTVTLDQSAPNSQQGRSATAAYTWDAVQLTGQTFNQ